VIPVGEEGQDKKLVAYLVLRDPSKQAELTAAELHRFLLSRIPHYSIPSVFAVLNQLPVSILGKMDKKKLPDHTTLDSSQLIARRAEGVQDSVLSPLQENMQAVWMEVLKVGLHTVAHSCTLLHTLAHSCTLLHTVAHSCTL
jgi:hypothetical protein